MAIRFPYKLVTIEKLGFLEAEYRKLLNSNATATAFIKEIEAGKLETILGQEAGTDEGLSSALQSMQQQLQKIAEEEKERNWSSQGLALFAEILRSESNDIKGYYQKIISELVKYLGANQGGLFLVNEQDNGETSIELVSCYAYNRQKFLTKQIRPGEGLVGQCFLEKETIFMTDLPQDYVSITSGLGTANPACLAIVPLKVNEIVHGFVEIAGFQQFKGYQVEFLEKVGEIIASSISSVKINQHTRRLLEESQEQAEQMRAQEEEMRQNMEELQATQEEMQRILKEVQGSETFIKDLIDATNDLVISIGKNYKITTLNKAAEKTFKDSGLIIGKGSDVFEVIDQAQKEQFKSYYDRALGGESFVLTDSYILNGKELYVELTYSPLHDEKRNIIGAVEFTKDITGLIQAQKQTEKLLAQSQHKEEELKAQEEEMRQNLEELSATQEEMERILSEVQRQEAFMKDLINATADSILTIDADYKIITCNNTMVNTYKAYGLELKSGFDILQVFTEEQKPTYKAYYDRALKGESFEITENYKFGEKEQFFLLTYSPLRNEKEEIIGVAVFAKDLTETIMAKQETERLLKESQEQADEMKAQEEELRQNVEELHAIHENQTRMAAELQESEQQLKKQVEALDAARAEIEKVRKIEQERADERITSQRKATEKAIFKFKTNEQLLKEEIENLKAELNLLKNN